VIPSGFCRTAIATQVWPIGSNRDKGDRGRCRKSGLALLRITDETREKSMRTILACVTLLYSAAAFGQAASAPPAAEKPVKEAKSHSAPAKQSIAVRLQSCLDIDDGTKDRLNCYDAVLPPAPKPKAAAAKTVMECRFTKEEDERLGCYNGFVESMPLLPKG
jgi:hypothetical protein